jgi:hypothetical protein
MGFIMGGMDEISVSAVLGNSQRLDGGAMFGNAPKALWSRFCPPDSENRIDLACRALLIETGDRKILLETGIGVFFPPELRSRFGVVEESHVLLRSLHALGLSEDDITDVILSHLHFDHAGGLLAPYAAKQSRAGCCFHGPAMSSVRPRSPAPSTPTSAIAPRSFPSCQGCCATVVACTSFHAGRRKTRCCLGALSLLGWAHAGAAAHGGLWTLARPCGGVCRRSGAGHGLGASADDDGL